MRAITASLLVTCAMLASCQKSAPSTASSSTANAPAATANAPGAERVKQPRMGDAAVYVDGKSVAVMRALELPAGMKPYVSNLNGVERSRYGMLTYVKALGVDPATIKGIHFYGGRRVMGVPGDEIRRLGDDLKFSFTMHDRGKPRIHRPSNMRGELSIDMLTGVVIYVAKDPPVVTEIDGVSALAYADGKKVTGVPYADEEQGNGTRLYVDGKLTATLKRKTLSNKALLPGDDARPRFSLPAYLTSIGVDAKGAKAIDLVAGDDVIARSKDDSTLTFSLPAKSQGKAVFEVPKAREGETASARVSAIQLYLRTNPPARTVSPPEQDDVPGAGAGGGGGSKDDEG
jgi:hypothetical protein